MRSVKAKKKEDEDKEGKKTGTENFWQVQKKIHMYMDN